jgi:hypothetical protein
MKPLEPAVSLARSHGLAVENPIVLRDLSNLLVRLQPSPHLHEGWPITFWQADVSLVTLGRRPSGTTRTGAGACRCSARNAAPPPRLAGAERPG